MKRCGLVLLVLLAVPSGASAAQGPLLSLTPERVSSGRVALAGQPWRVRVVMQPWVEGQTPTAPQLVATPVRVSVTPVSVRPGARGPAVRLLQQELATLGYVVGQRGSF